MSDPSNKVTTRRGVLKLAATLPATLAALPVLLRTADARAAKMSKEQAQYQDEPNNGQKCINCQFYVKPASGSGPGECQVVAGEIAPEAWCALYAPTA